VPALYSVRFSLGHDDWRQPSDTERFSAMVATASDPSATEALCVLSLLHFWQAVAAAKLLLSDALKLSLEATSGSHRLPIGPGPLKDVLPPRSCPGDDHRRVSVLGQAESGAEQRAEERLDPIPHGATTWPTSDQFHRSKSGMTDAAPDRPERADQALL